MSRFDYTMSLKANDALVDELEEKSKIHWENYLEEILSAQITSAIATKMFPGLATRLKADGISLEMEIPEKKTKKSKKTATPTYQEIKAQSFTHLFFNHFKLNRYFKKDIENKEILHKNILELGCGVGSFLKDYQNRGWKVKGLDYIPKVINNLLSEGIPAREIDFNYFNSQERKSIEDDLSLPINIIAVRVLENIKSSTLIFLISTLIEAAKTGSMFFFVTKIDEPTDRVFHLPHNYIASFFGPRTDIQFRLMLKNSSIETYKWERRKVFDEILVIEKIARISPPSTRTP